MQNIHTLVFDEPVKIIDIYYEVSPISLSAKGNIEMFIDECNLFTHKEALKDYIQKQ